MTIAGTMGNDGGSMRRNIEPDDTGQLWSADSRREMECQLSSLRLLVCDLLQANQELRNVLQDAKTGLQGGEGPQRHYTPRMSGSCTRQ
jgi:hypothetical protein